MEKKSILFAKAIVGRAEDREHTIRRHGVTCRYRFDESGNLVTFIITSCGTVKITIDGTTQIAKLVPTLAGYLAASMSSIQVA